MLYRSATPIILAALFIFPGPMPEQGEHDAMSKRLLTITESGELRIQGAAIAAVHALPAFYQNNNYGLAWTDQSTFADLLLSIEEIHADGLLRQDYHYNELMNLQEQLQLSGGSRTDLLADRDLLASDALLRLLYHLRVGKVDPERIDRNWNLSASLDDVHPAHVLREALESGSIFEFVEQSKPGHRYYTEQKRMLAHYRAIAANGGWKEIAEGEVLKPGITDNRCQAVRNRLVVTGEIGDQPVRNPDLFDEPLEAAVRNFQQRHRLADDGVIGKQTLKAMNVSVEDRIDQIRVNLERGRWILHDLDPSYVIVNIAGFHAGFIEDDTIRYVTRVQVGKPFRKTPVFKSLIKYIVFNPTWTVPPTILAKDIIPAVKQDPAYLSRRHIRVISREGNILDPASVDWESYPANPFPYILRQDPGPWNALGIVKFMFPNEHSVYLHDTPSKSLFQREARTFSSGCIRVQDPLDLAELLLNDAVKWNQDAIAAVIRSAETKTVYLRDPVPVLLLYWTSRVDEKGRMEFLEDVYERDAAILESLNADFKPRRRDEN